MGDYVPYFPIREAKKSWTAQVPVVGGQVCFLSTAGGSQSNGSVSPTTAGSNLVVGVAAFDAVAGARVMLEGGGGSIQEVVASAAIALGPVKSAAAGQVAQFVDGTDAPGQMIGIALTTAASAGTLVRVLWLR